MTAYIACIRGHDIARSREVSRDCKTLSEAKKFAEEEFGGGFAHHEIALWQGHNEQMPIAVKPMFGRWS